MEEAQETLAAFTRYAHRSVDVASIVERAVDAAVQVLDVSLGALIRVVGRRPARLVVVQASAGLDVEVGEPYEVDPTLAVLLRGTDPLVVADPSADPRFAGVPLPGLQSPSALLAAAVSVDGYAWGRLLVADRRPRAFAEDDVALLARIAHLTGAAIERNRWQRARTTAALLSAHPPHLGQAAVEVALLDRSGVIVWVNERWMHFARENGGDPARTGVGMSYLECCDAAADPVADDVADAVRLAVRGDLPAPMRMRMPCHGPGTHRWFDVLVSSRLDDDGECLGATVTFSPAEPGSVD